MCQTLGSIPSTRFFFNAAERGRQRKRERFRIQCQTPKKPSGQGSVLVAPRSTYPPAPYPNHLQPKGLASLSPASHSYISLLMSATSSLGSLSHTSVLAHLSSWLSSLLLSNPTLPCPSSVWILPAAFGWALRSTIKAFPSIVYWSSHVFVLIQTVNSKCGMLIKKEIQGARYVGNRIPTFKRLRQEDQEPNSSLCHTGRFCLQIFTLHDSCIWIIFM